MTDGPLAGRRILVVEDEYVQASSLRDILREAGGQVVGPAPNTALALLLAREEHLDGAVLDARLADGLSTPVAASLSALFVPFIVLTGYSRSTLPQPLRSAPYLGKPADAGEIVDMALQHFRPGRMAAQREWST